MATNDDASWTQSLRPVRASGAPGSSRKRSTAAARLKAASDVPSDREFRVLVGAIGALREALEAVVERTSMLEAEVHGLREDLRRAETRAADQPPPRKAPTPRRRPGPLPPADVPPSPNARRRTPAAPVRARRDPGSSGRPN